MANEPFQSMYLCQQALQEVWGSNPRPSVRRIQRCKPFGHSGSAVGNIVTKGQEI